jgi:predicted DCC family thiol-disulfide oxidoreductase YuxK
VYFLLRRDEAGRIRFAPLQGALAREKLGSVGRDPVELDTVYVLADWQSPRQRVLERSRAVLHALEQLGGGWRWLARAAGLVPRPIADAVYGFIARRRYRLFGRYDACPLPRPEWKDRFVE